MYHTYVNYAIRKELKHTYIQGFRPKVHFRLAAEKREWGRILTLSFVRLCGFAMHLPCEPAPAATDITTQDKEPNAET